MFIRGECAGKARYFHARIAAVELSSAEELKFEGLRTLGCLLMSFRSLDSQSFQEEASKLALKSPGVQERPQDARKNYRGDER